MPSPSESRLAALAEVAVENVIRLATASAEVVARTRDLEIVKTDMCAH
jgi:hypothetical protein